MSSSKEYAMHIFKKSYLSKYNTEAQYDPGYDIWNTFWIIKKLNANTFNMTIESVYNGFQNISP